MIVRFQYRATDAQGRTQTGEVQASDRLKAENQLLDRGWTVVALEPAMSESSAGRALLSAGEVITLIEELQTLTRSGLPLPGGLRAASTELESKALGATFNHLAERLEGGEGLDEVLLAESNRFPAHLQGLVLAGDRSGRLADVLSEVVQSSNLGRELRQQVWATMAYPSVILAVIIVLTLFICRIATQALDHLAMQQQIFSLQPPQLIASVFALTKFIAENDIALVASALGIGVATWIIWARFLPPVARRRSFQTIPLVGPLARDVALAEFCHLMAVLVEGATPLPEAIRLAGASIRDPALSEDCQRVAAAVALGEPMSLALRLWAKLPAGLGQLLAWGEGEQNLADSLRFAGDMFEERAADQARFARQVLSSSLLLMIIWWIGFAIASIYLPIYYSIQILSKLI